MNDGYVMIHHGVKGMKWGVIRDRKKANSYSRRANKADDLYKKSYKFNEAGKYVKASKIKDKADKQYRKAEEKVKRIKDENIQKDMLNSKISKSMMEYKSKGVNNSKKKSGITARKNVIVRDFLERHRNTTLGMVGTGVLVAGSAIAASVAAVPVASITSSMLVGEALTVAGFLTDGAREIYREQRNLKYNHRR